MVESSFWIHPLIRQVEEEYLDGSGATMIRFFGSRPEQTYVSFDGSHTAAPIRDILGQPPARASGYQGA